LKQKQLESIIGFWEGTLTGIGAGLLSDVAEVVVALPPEAQRLALDILKESAANPVGWEVVRRFFTFVVAPMVKQFIADLRSLQEED
jgi:hypothetical protein